MRAGPSPLEDFLRAFHDERPQCTPAAFGARGVRAGERRWPSSYHALVDVALAHPAPPSPAARRVLDLGCGDGHLLVLIARQLQAAGEVAEVNGVDLSEGELAAARRQLGPGAHLVRARAQHLPFADAQMDLVVSHMALMLMDDAQRVIAEARRVCAPGACLAFVVSGERSDSPVSQAFVQALAGRQRRADGQGLRFGDPAWRKMDALAALIEPHFRELQFLPLTLSDRLSPQQAWQAVSGMYDLHLLEPGQQADVAQAFHAALQPSLGADGRAEHSTPLRMITSRASGPWR